MQINAGVWFLTGVTSGRQCDAAMLSYMWVRVRARVCCHLQGTDLSMELAAKKSKPSTVAPSG